MTVTNVADPQTRRWSDLIAPVVQAHQRLVEFGLYLLALALGWHFQFVQDDAFITFRYAQNLAKGYGLVLNPGERVEGYTNFLWTVIMAIPERFGWNTPLFSVVLGLMIFVGTVAVVLRLFRRILGSETRAVFAVLVLLANMSFVGYATGGLETMLQTLLVTGIAYLLLPAIHTPNTQTQRQLAASTLAGIALLVRLDSAVLIAAWYLITIAHQTRGTHWWKRTTQHPTPTIRELTTTITTLTLPLLAITTPWLAWKLHYYGTLLPNTFTAKSGASAWQPRAWGVFYLVGFLFSYAAFVLIGRWRNHRRSLFAIPGVTELAAVVGLWCLYIIYVGADFMEFRFLIPVMPFLAFTAAHLIDHFTSMRKQIAMMLVLAMFSFGHTQLRGWAFPVFTFNDLDHWPAEYVGSWRDMGQILGREFPGGIAAPGQPSVAVDPLGVIPYYSQLPAIDMLGLADAWVARHGITPQYYYPGHVRMAPVSYLVRRKVALVIGLPHIFERQSNRTSYRTGELLETYPVANLNDLPDDAQVVEVPLSDGRVWPVIALTPNAKVEALVDNGTWKAYPIVHSCRKGDITAAIALSGTQTCPT